MRGDHIPAWGSPHAGIREEYPYNAEPTIPSAWGPDEDRNIQAAIERSIAGEGGNTWSLIRPNLHHPPRGGSASRRRIRRRKSNKKQSVTRRRY